MKDHQTPNEIDKLTRQHYAEMVTLCGISYACEEKRDDLDKITPAITNLLKERSLETAGKWKLVAGPKVSKNRCGYNAWHSLAYVVQHENEFCFVVRGTNAHSHLSDIQDIPVSIEELGGAYVARGFNEIAETFSAETKYGFGDFFKEHSNNGEKWYITGHSQGGAVAPLVLYHLTQLLKKNGGNATLKGYGIAGPTPGDQTFADWLTNSGFVNITNTLDIVPHAYDRLDQVINNHIPIKLPFLAKLAVEAFKVASHEITWGDSSTYRVDLHGKQFKAWDKDQEVLDGGCKTAPQDRHPKNTFAIYLEHVRGQHYPNAYLDLLGAAQTTLLGPTVIWE